MNLNINQFNRLSKMIQVTFLDYVNHTLYNNGRRVLSNNPNHPERNNGMTRSIKSISPFSVKTALYSLMVILGIACTGAQAVIMQWVGPGRWSDNTKWNPAVVPTASDSAIFNSGGALCTLDVSYSVGAVTFTAGYTGQFHFMNTLSVAGDADFRTAGAIITYTGSLEFTGTAPQKFYPQANAYTANQIRQNGPGGTHVKGNGFHCVNLNITSGVLYLDTTSADSVAGTFTNSGSGGINFGVSTLKFAGQFFNLSTVNTLIAGTGTLEFCKEVSPRQEFTPQLNIVHPRILHSGGDTLLQLAPMRCNAFEQIKGTYNINGFRDTVVDGNFIIVNGTSNSLTGLAAAYIVVLGGGNASFSGQVLDSIYMVSASPWYVHVMGGSLSANFAKLQNCDAAGGVMGYATHCDLVSPNPNWTLIAPNYKTWTNATGNGKWSAAANWAPPGPPSPIDSVSFSTSLLCTLDHSTSIKAIRISASTGNFTFQDDTLRIADTADFSNMITSTIDLTATSALEFIGPGQHSLISKTGLLLPTLIQNGTGSTIAKLFRFKAKGLVVKNGTFSCGNVPGDSVTGTLSIESAGSLLLGNADFHVYEVSCFTGAGSIDFTTGSLTIFGPTNNALQFSGVSYYGNGKIYLQQSGSWHFLYTGVALPPIEKSGADSLILQGTLFAKSLLLTGGAWDWGSGGRKHMVDTIRTGGGSRMYFSFGPPDTVKTFSDVDLSGLASSGITAGAGVIIFEGTGVQALTPLANRLLPDIRHFGPGTLMLFGNLLCSSFLQNSGTLNTAGYNIVTSGNFSIINGTSSTIQGIGIAGGDSIAAASATFKGQPGDTLNLNRPNPWKLYVNGPLSVDFAKIKNCNATCSTGFANNSIDSGNTNWKFGKFWRGSGVDTLWTTTYNWAPPGPPQPSDSVIFDNSAYYGSILNGAVAVRAITLTSGYTHVFNFGSSALTVSGTTDLRSTGTIVPGTGALQLTPTSASVWFYNRPLNPLPKIVKSGTGTVVMSDAVQLVSPLVSVNNGSLQLFKPFFIDSLNVTSPGNIMFDNAVVHTDTVRAIAGNGVMDMGWASLYVTGSANLSQYASVSVSPKSRIIFAGNSPHSFAPPAVTVFPYVGTLGSSVTTISYRGLSADTLDVISGAFNCGSSLMDTVKSQLSGNGIFDFSTSTLVLKAASANFNTFSAVNEGTGILVFAGTSAQTMLPKPGMMHLGIVCNNSSGLSISGNPLVADYLALKTGIVSFADAAAFNDTIGDVISVAGGGTRGLDLGNDTLNMEGAVDLSAFSMSFQPAAALRFFGNLGRNFQPSASVQHPNIILSGSGIVNQTGPLKCRSFMQTAGTYNLSGNQDTVTSGDFTIMNGSSSSITGLDGAAIVVIAGNAGFLGQSASRMALSPASPWRLDVSGSKYAQFANIGNCNASGGSIGQPTNCSMGTGNINWDESMVLPRLFDTTGSPAYLFASQRKDGSDAVDLYYQLSDPDDALDTVSLKYRNGLSGTWTSATSVSGDAGPVSAADSSIHRHILWNFAAQLGGSFVSDSLQLMVMAVDAYNNKTSLITPNKSFVTSTIRPAVSSAALVAPNGGEKLPAGLPFNVYWNATSIASGGNLKNSPIELSYSLDNGVSFPNVFASGLPNSGSYSWLVPMITGSAVRLRIAVTDTFGHTGYDISDAAFTIDSTKPQSAVVFPANGAVVPSLSAVSGTAIDAGSGIKSVMVSLKDQTSGDYWTGFAWISSPIWIAATGAATWTFPCPALINSNVYNVVSQAYDSASNAETPGSGVTFTYSSSAPGSPAVAFSGVNRWTNISAPTLSVFAVNADSMRLRLDAGPWGAWEPYAAIKSAYAISPGGQGMRKVYAQFKDRAGNATAAVSDSILYDTVAPSCAMAVHGIFGFWAWPGSVSGTASDNLAGVRTVFVRLKNETTGYFWDGSSWVTDSLWITTSGAGSWQIALPAISLRPGRSLVDMRAVDSAGNAGATMVDSFTFIQNPVNNLSVLLAGIGDSAIAISWHVDTTIKYLKNVLFGCGPAADKPDTAALTPYPCKDTSFIVAPAIIPGLWLALTRILDSAGNVSTLRRDSILILNTPPMLAHSRDTALDEGMPWTGSLFASDINGDSVRFLMEKAPAGFVLDSVRGTMHWTPRAADAGSALCIVQAHDARGATARDTFTITVRMVNKPPVIAYSGDSIAREDFSFAGRIAVSDPNPGDSGRFVLVRRPAWMKFLGDSLTGAPGAADVAMDTLSLVAIDNGGLLDTLTKVIAVVHTNHAPMTAGFVKTDTMRQYGKALWTFAAVDKDRGDSLFLSWQDRPTWLNAGSALTQGATWTFTLAAAPTSLDKGWVSFAFAVRDTAGASLVVRDSVYIVSLPTTAIKQRLITFGAVRYTVTGGNGAIPAAAFEARLRGLDDTSFSVVRTSVSGQFGFYPLLDGRYEFTARAIDADGLRDTVPPKEVFTISGASRHTFTDTSWTMVSVPGHAFPMTEFSVGGHVLHWDESMGDENVYRYYRRESAMGATTPGLAYWRKGATPVTISLIADDLSDSATGVSISKDAYGWNQVASPYPYPVAWPSGTTVWKWNASTSDYEDAAGVLDPWSGYWINADSSATVRIAPTPVFSSGATAKRSIYFAGSSDWKIKVSLYGREGNDADNVFGFSPNARDGFDAADRPEPPRMEGSRYAFFWHPEWGRHVKEFASDVRRGMKKTNAFQIGITPSPVNGAPVRMVFQGVGNLSSLYCFFADADTVFKIEGNRGYELAPSASTVFKTVFVTADRDYLKHFPMKFALVNPQPNPCRPMTVISYTLPYRFAKNGLLNERPYAARMALFDAMGRKVRQLVMGNQEPGVYRVVWDGKTASGRIAAPGAYFCRLEANEYSATTRMTMMR
jgi:hypothetical protein